MPKPSMGLALTYLLFIVAVMGGIYLLLVRPLVKRGYENLTQVTIPNFIKSTLKK